MATYTTIYSKTRYLFLKYEISYVKLICQFGYYGNLEFPQIYNGKSDSRPLFLSDFRHFDKSFTVMFLEESNNHMNYV